MSGPVRIVSFVPMGDSLRDQNGHTITRYRNNLSLDEWSEFCRDTAAEFRAEGFRLIGQDDRRLVLRNP